MTGSYIVAARRSTIAPRDGDLKNLPIEALAVPVVTQVLQDAGVRPAQVDEIIVSNALGAGGNPARILSLAAGLPEVVAGLSIDRQCVGGLDAILLADSLIRSGQCDIVIAGGVESYSRRPLRYRTFSDGYPPTQYEQAQFTPWPERDPDMAAAADRLAAKMKISREVQDEWAVQSHESALRARELCSSELVNLGGLEIDPFTRHLSHKTAARAKQISGSITTANMAVAADGAAFAMVVSERMLRDIDVMPFEIVCGLTVGGNPELPGLAPVAAINRALSSARLHPSELIAAEIMEAFAVQAIACQRETGLRREIVNSGGGALAWGHPIGASGAVMAANLFHRLKRNSGFGLAAIAAAGGLGSALLLRSVS